MKKAISAMALAMVLAGCGGGGGGGGSGTISTPPVPAPSPTPSPTPTPSPSPGAIGLTQLQDFPTLGWGYRYTTDPDGSNAQGPAAPDPAEVIEFSYRAVEQAYDILIPGIPRGRLQLLQTFSRFSSTSLTTAPRPSFTVSLYRPGVQNEELALAYTSLGVWSDPIFDPAVPGRRAHNDGSFAYGVPTEAVNLPATGTVRYSAIAHGMAAIEPGNPPTGNPAAAGGTADLLFDFAAGTLSGSFSGVLFYGIGGSGIGQYQITQVTYSRGSVSFSGRLIQSGVAGEGFFEGRFTGPQADELMVRWQVPYLDPETRQPGTAFGVWIGRRL